MGFSTYILQSEKDSSFYIGYSENPETRLAKHNSAKSGYTSRKQPWVIVYKETFIDKTSAIRREIEIKKWKSKVKIQELIQSRNNELE